MNVLIRNSEARGLSNLKSAALLSSALMLSAPAFAAAPELTISGNLDFNVVGGDRVLSTNAGGGVNPATQNVGADENGYDFGRANSHSEIRFLARGESDGGGTYGANIQYRYAAAETDEAYIFIAGDWGRVHLGDDDGVSDFYSIYPGTIAGRVGVDGTLPEAIGHSIDRITHSTSDATKVTYVSPEVNNFEFGASLSEYYGVDRNGVFADGEELGYGDFHEVAARYTSGNTDSFRWGLSAVYIGASASDTNENFEDIAEWNLGLQLGYGNFDFVLNLNDAGDSAKNRHVDIDDAESLTNAEITTLVQRAVDGDIVNNDLVVGRKQISLGLAYDLGGRSKISLSAAVEGEGRTIVTSTGAPGPNNTYAGSGGRVLANSIISLDYSFPILPGMDGYAGVARIERRTIDYTYDSLAIAPGGGVTAGDSTKTERKASGTAYILGTTVSF